MPLSGPTPIVPALLRGNSPRNLRNPLEFIAEIFDDDGEGTPALRPAPAEPKSVEFPSGLKFLHVPWTFQKANEIKNTRFDVALGAFKMNLEVPFLKAYQEIHEKKSVEYRKISRETIDAERKKAKEFKKSLHGYKEKCKRRLQQSLGNIYVPPMDPLPTEDQLREKATQLDDPEILRPYLGLSTAAAIRKFLKEEWGKSLGPIGRVIGGELPGLDRRFHPYLDDWAYEQFTPDPWNYWNFEVSDQGYDFEPDESDEYHFFEDNRPLEEIDPELSKHDPDELVVDFRALVNLENKLTEGSVNPRQKPPAMRTPEDRAQIKEEHEQFVSFYELRAWMYARRKLQAHGLLPPEDEVPPSSPLLGITDDDEAPEKDIKDDASKAKAWLLDDLARKGVSTSEDETEDILNIANTKFTGLKPKDSNKDALLQEIRTKRRKIKELMDSYWQSVRTKSLPKIRDFPLEFVTTYAIDPDQTMGSLARREFLHRKVILRVHVPSLGLPKVAEERLKKLVESRYDEDTEILKIVADKHPNKSLNKRYAKRLLKELISNALLADPNYVPVTDLAADIKTLIPRPQLPEELQEVVTMLEAPPLVQEQQQKTKRTDKDYRWFRFNFYGRDPATS